MMRMACPNMPPPSPNICAHEADARSRVGLTWWKGSPQGQTRVIFEFPSVQAFKEWQEAPEYQELKALCRCSAVINLIGTERV